MPVLDSNNKSNRNPDNVRTHALFCQHCLAAYQQTVQVFAIHRPIQWPPGIITDTAKGIPLESTSHAN